MDIQLDTWYRAYTTSLHHETAGTTIGKVVAIREDRETLQRFIRLENAIGGAEMPETYIVGPVELRACYQCGCPQATVPGQRTMCPRCKATGHLFRLMTADELRVSAQRQRELGYEHIAQKRERIADSLPN